MGNDSLITTRTAIADTFIIVKCHFHYTKRKSYSSKKWSWFILLVDKSIGGGCGGFFGARQKMCEKAHFSSLCRKNVEKNIWGGIFSMENESTSISDKEKRCRFKKCAYTHKKIVKTYRKLFHVEMAYHEPS